MPWLSAWTGDSSPVKARGLSPRTDGQTVLKLLLCQPYQHKHEISHTVKIYIDLGGIKILMSWLSAWTGDSSLVKARGLSQCTDGQTMVQLHVRLKRLIVADYLHDCLKTPITIT